MNRANLGHTGEAVAAKYYIRQGYLLLNHNYRTRMGELHADIHGFAVVT